MNASFQTAHASPLSSPVAWLQQLMGFVSASGATTSARRQMVTLEPGDTLVLSNPGQRELLCLAGALWITHDELPEDHVVERGQRYVPAADSRMSVHAMNQARVCVSWRQA
jgi:redox-sensitive bicupin YhaK (pirin superfamily)